MIRRLGLVLVVIILISRSVSLSAAPLRQSPMADPAVRQERVETLRTLAQQQKSRAMEIADTQGFPVRWQIGHTIQELMRIDGTRIWVYTTTNSNAAISAAVTPIRQTAPYFLDGTGQLVGLWDGGDVRSTHQELVGRITKLDNVGNSNHATHVAGTILASGVVSSAKGMSPAATIDSYDFNSDLSEMTGRAMVTPGQSGTIQTSNHSYTYITGWDYNFSPPRWYGTWQGTPTYESDMFGQYGSDSRAWDDLCYDAPYYLPIKAAGNDRNDSPPSQGSTFQYYTFPSWKTTTYDSAIHPRNDGWDNGGYDTMTTVGCAKNILTIGAVQDAVTSGQRDPSKATVVYFSNWGPTDDGRIKPDIVANGWGLYSSLASSDTSYGTYSGTSMATPNTTGAANLILQQYSNSYPGQYMRSATLKGLIIHTADDVGNPGPDYSYGFGLMNAQAAVDVIIDAAAYTIRDILIEDALTTGQPTRTYQIDYNGTGPIKATLCWTEPAGTAQSGLDNTTLVLVNDLDLRVIHPNSTTTYMPYVLDPANPGNSATTGDNIRDNVEMVEIEIPPVAGIYTVEVTYKGTLTNSVQDFSLLTTGNSSISTPPTTPTSITCDGGDCNGTFAGDVEIECSGSIDAEGDTITYSVEALLDGTVVTGDLESGTVQMAAHGGTSTVILHQTSFESGDDTTEGYVDDGYGDWDWVDTSPRTGSYGPHVDDADNDSTYTYNSTIDLTPYESCSISVWMKSDGTLENDEYVALDYASTGSNWNLSTGYSDPLALAGAAEDDNTYHEITLDIPDTTGFSAFKWRFRADIDHQHEDAWIDDITVSAQLVLPPDTEASTDWMTYSDVDSDSPLVSEIEVELEVDSYNPESSVLKGNAHPDLELEMYNGSSWLSIGTFNLPGTYTGDGLDGTNHTFTLSTTDAAILTAWQSSANQDIRIRGVNMDYSDETTIDEINYINVLVRIHGKRWSEIGSHTAGSGYLWDIIGIPDQTNVDLKCRAIDPEGSNTYSDDYDPAVNLTISNTHTVTFIEGANGSITGILVQFVDHGNDCTEVTAVPDTGYYFVDWTGDYSGTTNPLTITNVTADMTVTASFALNPVAISGIITEPDLITPVADVSIKTDGANTTTDPNGYFELIVDSGFSGTVTPAKVGYTFEPNSITYSDVTSDPNDSYVATLDTFTVSGFVIDSQSLAPLPGVLLSPDNDGGPFTSKYYGGGTDVTDANGLYEVQLDYDFSGDVVPSKTAYTFTPDSITYLNVTEDVAEVEDTVGTFMTFSIQGYIKNGCDVPIADVLVEANNGGGSDTTDPNGFYEIRVDYNFSGAATPSKQNYTFDPNMITYANVLDDHVEQDYTATNIFDLNCDGSIEVGDLEILCGNWLLTGPNLPGDFYKDPNDIINLFDYEVFSGVWGE